MDKRPGARHLSGMAEIINLRVARKAKARADGSAKAAENRARFGRTKAAKRADAADAERVEKLLDQAKRES